MGGEGWEGGRETEGGESMEERGRGRGGGQRGQEMGGTTVSHQSCRERGEPKRERKVVVIWMFP